MAGIGPAPAEKRRRTNEPERGDWTFLEPLATPALPDLPDDQEWSARTIETWDMWRNDPVTGQFSSADLAYALDTIRLYEEGMSLSRAKEVRMRMTELGLTPEGKKKLRYRLVAGEESRATPTVQRRRSHGRRSRLSVVK